MLEIDKIHLGDSYELIKEVNDKSIDLVIIYPPYQFTTGGGGGAFGSKNRKYHQEVNRLDTEVTKAKQKYLNEIKGGDSTKESERLRVIANANKHKLNLATLSKGFTNDILDELCRVMKKINIYIWCNKEQLCQILNYFNDKSCNLDLLTWHKTNPMPTCNNTYLSDTEYCVFAREKGVKVLGTVKTKGKYYVTPANVADKKKYKHPTIKPLEIIKNLIINSSEEGDTVLDCFSGSGTTCVASKSLKRSFIGIELDKEYHQISIDRLNDIDSNGQMSIFTDYEQAERKEVLWEK